MIANFSDPASVCIAAAKAALLDTAKAEAKKKARRSVQHWDRLCMSQDFPQLSVSNQARMRPKRPALPSPSIETKHPCACSPWQSKAATLRAAQISKYFAPPPPSGGVHFM